MLQNEFFLLAWVFVPGLAGFGALVSSARVHRFAWFLCGAEFLRNIVLNQKFLATLRACTAAEENGIHHCPDYQRRVTVRAADVLFPVRQFDFSTRSGHRCIKSQGADLAKERQAGGVRPGPRQASLIIP